MVSSPGKTSATSLTSDAALERRPGDMALPERDLEATHVLPARPQPSRLDGFADAIEDVPREELGRRVPALEHPELVEVLVVQLAQGRLELLVRAADVDHDPVLVHLGTAELEIDDEGGSVQPLRRPEHLALEAVRDHDVLAHPDAEHACPLRPAGRRCAGIACR